MTSLLKRLLRLFPESVRLEDLFTEAVARLFERRPDLCLAWLKEAGLLPEERDGGAEGGWVRVSSQRRFVSLDHHNTDSRPDLLIEAHWPFSDEPDDGEAAADAVMVESKIGSGEGQEQLRRYAGHLDAMAGFDGKALLYVTRAYDPKDEKAILEGFGENVRFAQLRWHDFYRFLNEWAKKDALVEEVMLFMEEQGMARDYRFSATDLVALSGMPRAVEIMDETIGGEVRTELEAFTGGKSRMESISNFRRLGRYGALAQLHGYDLFCLVCYHLGDMDEYPWLAVDLQAQPRAAEREVSVAAMRKIARRGDWEDYNLDDRASWAGVSRGRYLADFLSEDDHIAAVKSFFIESVNQLRKELTAFKKEHPELPWGGPYA